MKLPLRISPLRPPKPATVRVVRLSETETLVVGGRVDAAELGQRVPRGMAAGGRAQSLTCDDTEAVIGAADIDAGQHARRPRADALRSPVMREWSHSGHTSKKTTLTMIIDKETSSKNKDLMVPQEGFEPPTPSLRMRCSTN